MNQRLKDFIFKRLYDDLKDLEIIEHEKTNSIWFIDREKRYWYLTYEKTAGILHWRWDFFINFFCFFSMKSYEFEGVLSEWAEEVLNCKVNKLNIPETNCDYWVEEVLNYKVNKLTPVLDHLRTLVGEVLNKSFWNIFRKPKLVKNIKDIRIPTSGNSLRSL